MEMPWLLTVGHLMSSVWGVPDPCMWQSCVLSSV